ncbi:transmembrane protein 144b isoform X2 [Ictalurus punctatus]|uniref:Transmembrane protein 144b isoform X2 n=1 Tax=Ictalurus punctatus TaxID=7998 RepID=A0A2D0RE50_ICTPU|nr:transmembrane protein 144b isoform X2 [Ictalurus punctatus]
MNSDGAVRSLGAVLFLVIFLSLMSGEVGEPLHSDPQDEGDAGDAAGGVSGSSVHMEKVYGFVSCVVAVLLYGTIYVPVKKVETGDGMFYQWISCAAIWVVALIGDILLRSSKAHPAAMLGGMIWATGNICLVPVVKCVGLGLGMLLWGASGLLIGWASSLFGLFGLEPEVVSRPLLNYCGAALCLLSTLLFFFVKIDAQKPSCSEATPILIQERSFSDGLRSTDSWVDTISPKSRRPLSGLLFCSEQWDFPHEYAVFCHLLRCDEEPTSRLPQSRFTRSSERCNVGNCDVLLVAGEPPPRPRGHLPHSDCWIWISGCSVGKCGLQGGQRAGELPAVCRGVLHGSDRFYPHGPLQTLRDSD